LTGFWQTINDKTGKPSSVIAVYPYEGNYYGRIIATYNEYGVIDDSIYKPKDRAPGIEGTPYYSGIDIVWEMKPTNKEKYKGSITDPKAGKVYRAELWREGENLILRGKVFVFGKNITWLPFSESRFTSAFKKPDLATFVPVKPITL
jgi:uncharacterized protein (DUF2147 family)